MLFSIVQEIISELNEDLELSNNLLDEELKKFIKYSIRK